jgi:hypothetical protein
VKKFRKLSPIERIMMSAAADRIEREVDRDLANLYRRCIQGDDTALVPACDRLREIGRDADADNLQRLIGV